MIMTTTRMMMMMMRVMKEKKEKKLSLELTMEATIRSATANDTNR